MRINDGGGSSKPAVKPSAPEPKPAPAPVSPAQAEARAEKHPAAKAAQEEPAKPDKPSGGRDGARDGASRAKADGHAKPKAADEPGPKKPEKKPEKKTADEPTADASPAAAPAGTEVAPAAASSTPGVSSPSEPSAADAGSDDAAPSGERPRPAAGDAPRRRGATAGSSTTTSQTRHARRATSSSADNVITFDNSAGRSTSSSRTSEPRRDTRPDERRDGRPSRDRPARVRPDRVAENAALTIAAGATAVAGASGGATVEMHGSARVVTINIHKLVPASIDRTDAVESEKALADVAAWINKLNPDVVVFQELDNDVARDGKAGVNEQLARLAQLVSASGSAMASATQNAAGDTYDNAIITRNGFTLDSMVNADLDVTPGEQNRSLGIASVRTPDGAQFTTMFTHTSPHSEGVGDRALQFDQIAALTAQLRSTGSIAVTDAITGQAMTYATEARTPIVLAGDLNASWSEARTGLEGSRLHNVANDPAIDGDAAARERARAASFGRNHRFDYIYVSTDVTTTDTWVEEVTADRVKGDRVTDHRAVVADLVFQ